MKTMTGKIIALSTPQTAKVSVAHQWVHPLYKKSVIRTKNYACHFTDLELAVGDQVTIESCRPVSKTKHFSVVSKIEDQA
ncbi:30S ribosomal protein S17 [Candidatus Woesebacteria bacterium]|nr:30S ribosomal protein S17 [Candidatus Woesebacteria bacterium]